MAHACCSKLYRLKIFTFLTHILLMQDRNLFLFLSKFAQMLSLSIQTLLAHLKKLYNSINISEDVIILRTNILNYSSYRSKDTEFL